MPSDAVNRVLTRAIGYGLRPRGDAHAMADALLGLADRDAAVLRVALARIQGDALTRPPSPVVRRAAALLRLALTRGSATPRQLTPRYASGQLAAG